MPFNADQCNPTDAALSDVLATIASHADVAGILLMGTTGSGELTPTSDYDLLLVFRDAAAAAGARIITTWIEGRLAEVYCTTETDVERIVTASEPWPDVSEAGVVLTWLRDGRVAYDADGRLQFAQERARHAPTPTLPNVAERYEAWRKINYNVAQLRRYLADDAPGAGLAVDMRLLYSVAEVNGHYFTVRQLSWRGEKPALRYWSQHDPAYLELLRDFVAATERERKVALYEQLAQAALAPAGGLVAAGATIVGVGAPFGGAETAAGAAVDAVSALWERLVTPAAAMRSADPPA